MPRQKKSVMEEELQEYAGRPHQNRSDEGAAQKILHVIKEHMRETTEMKEQWLDVCNDAMYGVYANIESAYILLVEDLQKEGLWR